MTSVNHSHQSRRQHILAIDQGTTGSRALIFDDQGRITASAYQEFKQYFPQPGWVEHDAQEIWDSCVRVIRRAIAQSRIPAKNILAIGITNQRETTVMWDRKTSRPVHRAIVWQCRRTASMCADKFLKHLEPLFRSKTGLVLDPYFSGTKIRWLLDDIPNLRTAAHSGRVCFGTIDTWLLWRLTGGKTHATDPTNASRTLLFNIRKLKWDEELLKILKIPPAILPEVRPSGSIFGKTSAGIAGLPQGIPVCSVMGDQQSALYGQGCYDAGTIKNTYGTGCFMVLNTGSKLLIPKDGLPRRAKAVPTYHREGFRSLRGLLATVACDAQGRAVYALEGSVFIAGAVVQWLRDQLGIITRSKDSERLIQGLKDTQGVYFVPAFTGLGAPYWEPKARGMICGLTRGADRRHIARAALESIAYQTKDVFEAMQGSFRGKIRELRVDGGACQNNFLMQFQSDMLGVPLIRSKTIESTAQGVAHLAGLTVGLWQESDLEKFYLSDRVFRPTLNPQERKKKYQGWLRAIGMVMSGHRNP